MKTYSKDAVTASDVNELDARQTKEINKLKMQVAYLLGGEIGILCLVGVLFWLN